MSPDTIKRYQPGGDIYNTLLNKYGKSIADNVAAAAATGDETAVNAAIPGAYSGVVATPLDTSTASIFTDQILTDPLAAPAEALNNQIGNALKNLFVNPFVLLAAVGIGIAAWMYLRKK
jgi:hypothetical protein